jgi:hypothetical protein
VFDLPSTINFAKSFNHILDFSKRDNSRFMFSSDRKALWRAATPFNPDSNWGKRLIDEAMNACSILSSMLKTNGKTCKGTQRMITFVRF